MNSMLLFLGVCLFVGLWSPSKSKLKGIFLGMATLLIVLYMVLPRYL